MTKICTRKKLRQKIPHKSHTSYITQLKCSIFYISSVSVNNFTNGTDIIFEDHRTWSELVTLMIITVFNKI